MTLKERINSEFVTAFKEKNTLKKSLLSVVKGEIQTSEKNLNVQNMNDEDILKILNKFAKSIKENIELGNETAKSELEIIQSYLPKEMTESEIEIKVNEIVQSGITNIGQIMKEFTGLQVDKRKVSEIAKKMIG
jgi:uncharacterized protein